MLPRFLTTKYPLEKHLFLVQRFGLGLIGFYPENNANYWSNLWAIFNFLILAYGSYAELYFGLLNLRTDFASALDALCPVASSVMSLVKISCIWWHRKEFKYIMQEIRRLSLTQDSMEKSKVKGIYFVWATRMSALLLLAGIATSTTYSIRMILMNLIRYFNGLPIIYETPFKMILPAVLVRQPLWPITSIMTQWHGYITVISFVGGDGFFLSFCLYFSFLLRALSFDLRDALKDGKNFKTSTQIKIRAKLSVLVQRHNEIIELSKKFTKIMVIITLGHFVTSSAIIGMSIIDLMLFSGYSIFVYIVYTIAAFTEICLYCIGGTAIAETSADLANFAYCSSWYNHNVEVQKMVLLIIMRAQRSIEIRVPFFVPSLPALTSILKFAGSLITLANSTM